GASGDLGVDLIASKGQDRIAIQVKRYGGTVSRRAISDAVAGMQHYRCNQAMVITNSRFTPGAITLAKSTQCSLIDRDELVKWIIRFQTPSIHPNTPGLIGLKLMALDSLCYHHLGVRLKWPIVVVAVTVLFALIYASQNRPQTRPYVPAENKNEVAKEVSQSPTLGNMTQSVRSTATPVNQVNHSPVTPQEAASNPSTIESQLTNPDDTSWPDGKSLVHPEHFIVTHIINLAKKGAVKLRGGPGIRCKVLAQIPSDATHIVAFDQDQVWDGNNWWCPVEWKGIRGYISRVYLPQ
ncbi:MAG: restriction endonuclease, partial [Verrucomicrobia bacterium]|nr:restriction endonuclease [Verrucomicrobiota bacterium]